MKRSKDNHTFYSVDLFAGAGGVTEGFRREGFEALFANDHEEPALETFKHNHPKSQVSSADVETIDPKELRESLSLKPGELDVLLGGPPCQGFSTYGKRDPSDYRNGLYQYYLKFLKEFRPKAFVIENVTGMLTLVDGKIIEDIKEQAKSFGYGVDVWVLDAADYGVPQFRKRVFITGGTDRQVLDKPVATHAGGDRNSDVQQLLLQGTGKNALLPAITVRQSIADLPEEVLLPRQTHQTMAYKPSKNLTEYQEFIRSGSEVLHHHSAKQMLGIRRLRLALLRPGDYGTRIAGRLAQDGLPDEVIDELLNGNCALRDLSECRSEDREKELELRAFLKSGHKRVQDVLEWLDSRGFANKYRRLLWDSPSHTLVAHMARDCSDFVHPDIDRFISVREAARLQSFPDTYIFKGSQFQQFRQIGNAVPPILAAAVARSVSKFLGGQPNRSNRPDTEQMHLVASMDQPQISGVR